MTLPLTDEGGVGMHPPGVELQRGALSECGLCRKGEMVIFDYPQALFVISTQAVERRPENDRRNIKPPQLVGGASQWQFSQRRRFGANPMLPLGLWSNRQIPGNTLPVEHRAVVLS